MASPKSILSSSCKEVERRLVEMQTLFLAFFFWTFKSQVRIEVVQGYDACSQEACFYQAMGTV